MSSVKKRIMIGSILLAAVAMVLLLTGMLFLWEKEFISLYSVAALLLIILIITGFEAHCLAKAIAEPVREINPQLPARKTVYSELHPLLNLVQEQRVQIDAQITELQNRQREFAMLTENMKEGLVVINNQGYILSMNACAMGILGLQNYAHYEDKHILMARHTEKLQKLIDEGLEGFQRDVTMELDGRVYQIVSNPVSEFGQIQGIVLLLLDVTEKQQQEQLRREFTANVSHELRTPLTAISGYAEIMMHGLVAAEDVQPFAEKIYKEANRLIALLADIIQLSRLDEATDAFQREEVDIALLAEETVLRLQEKADAHAVAMTIYTEPTVMNGIRPVLQEILYNLCDNAIKYNKVGGTVKVSVVRSGGNAIIKVIDNGMGIAPEDQPRIFERFYRADKSHSRRVDGTGLGLSIVKHGVQMHQGDVHLESALGAGTSITVRLPLALQEL